MQAEKGLHVEVQPIIDSGNPPIGVDSVILGQNGTGAVRLACFAGDAFIEREEVRSSGDKDIKKLWMRLVCVLDIGNSAVRFIEHYLVYRLSENVEELRNALDSMPEATEKLYTAMKSLMGESNAKS